MRMLHFTGILAHTALVDALYNHDSRRDDTTYDYIIFSYFGSFHYSFIFVTDHKDGEQEYGALGHVIVQLMEIPLGNR
jgi:hypothetical protein